MESIARQRKRVCYIRSVPEWFGHTVNDLFFREEEWVFVPIQDLTPEKKLREYKKASYFFISGFGHEQEAIDASKAGAILVGARLDVPSSTRVIECPEWDYVGLKDSLLAIEKYKIYLLPKGVQGFAVKLARKYKAMQRKSNYYTGLVGYFRMATKKNFQAGGFNMVVKKFFNYFWGEKKS